MYLSKYFFVYKKQRRIFYVVRLCICRCLLYYLNKVGSRPITATTACREIEGSTINIFPKKRLQWGSMQSMIVPDLIKASITYGS